MNERRSIKAYEPSDDSGPIRTAELGRRQTGPIHPSYSPNFIPKPHCWPRHQDLSENEAVLVLSKYLLFGGVAFFFLFFFFYLCLIAKVKLPRKEKNNYERRRPFSREICLLGH